jgi:hypothetical protein
LIHKNLASNVPASRFPLLPAKAPALFLLLRMPIHNSQNPTHHHPFLTSHLLSDVLRCAVSSIPQYSKATRVLLCSNSDYAHSNKQYIPIMQTVPPPLPLDP